MHYFGGDEPEMKETPPPTPPKDMLQIMLDNDNENYVPLKSLIQGSVAMVVNYSNKIECNK